jgi:hypothetical protein
VRRVEHHAQRAQARRGRLTRLGNWIAGVQPDTVEARGYSVVGMQGLLALKRLSLVVVTTFTEVSSTPTAQPGATGTAAPATTPLVLPTGTLAPVPTTPTPNPIGEITVNGMRFAVRGGITKPAPAPPSNWSSWMAEYRTAGPPRRHFAARDYSCAMRRIARTPTI